MLNNFKREEIYKEAVDKQKTLNCLQAIKIKQKSQINFIYNRNENLKNILKDIGYNIKSNYKKFNNYFETCDYIIALMKDTELYRLTYHDRLKENTDALYSSIKNANSIEYILNKVDKLNKNLISISDSIKNIINIRKKVLTNNEFIIDGCVFKKNNNILHFLEVSPDSSIASFKTVVLLVKNCFKEDNIQIKHIKLTKLYLNKYKNELLKIINNNLNKFTINSVYDNIINIDTIPSKKIIIENCKNLEVLIFDNKINLSDLKIVGNKALKSIKFHNNQQFHNNLKNIEFYKNGPESNKIFNFLMKNHASHNCKVKSSPSIRENLQKLYIEQKNIRKKKNLKFTSVRWGMISY